MESMRPENPFFEIISRFPEGASLEEILLGLDPSMSRRTLQRQLALLVKKGRLIATGKTKGRRYKLLQVTDETSINPINLRIPISQAGRQIQLEVSRPIEMRNPVFYNRNFLERYRPGSTYYLSETLRQHLLKMGQSKEETYPAGTYAKEVFHRLLIDLSWNSSRLEGNTYSLLETERLLDTGSPAEGKNLKDTQMILNHKAAIEFLVQTADDIGLNRYTILNLHTLLSDNLMPDPSASGRLRWVPVGIAKSVYQPSPIPQVIEDNFDLLLAKANAIKDPFEQSFFLMVHLPYLQPFDDVNKRTSRLAANIPLIRGNLCPLSFIDVPEEAYVSGLLGVYELNQVDLLRDVFTWAYERSSDLYSTMRKILGEPDPFRLKYRSAISQVVREVVLKSHNNLKAIQEIRKFATHLPKEDQSRFIEIVERELQSLHEGNIARHQLKPSDFDHWKKSWD